MKTGPHRRADVHMAHLMKMVGVEMVMEAIDEDKAHTRANEKRRPPIPLIRIRVVPDRVHKNAVVRALDNLPRPITLQACPFHDLLRRAINIGLSQYGAARGSGVNVRTNGVVVSLCKRGSRKTHHGEHYSQPNSQLK